MILIGNIKSIEKNIAVVYCADVEADIEAMILQTLGNSEDILYKVDEQVAVYVQDGRNILLGAVFSNNKKPNLTELFKRIIDILRNMKVSTPSGTSGTPLPDIIKKIDALENDFKTFLNID